LGVGDEARVFSHSLALLPVVVVAELVVLFYVGYLIFRDPDVLSPKGAVVVVLWVIANCGLCQLIGKFWRTRSALILSPSRLVVLDRSYGTRLEIPWSAINAVEKMSPYWWNRGGPLVLNEIVTGGGQRIPFGTHLSRYSEFISELKTYASDCHRFDPHPRGIGE